MTKRSENLKKLDEFFINSYGKQLDALNAKMNIAEKDYAGNFRVPSIVLSDEGVTQIVGNDNAFLLNAPAVVRMADVWYKPLQTVYRVALPYSELEIGLERDPAYLSHFVTSAVKQALSKYKFAIGDENLTRFGEYYLEWRLSGYEGAVFMDTGEHFEFRFRGCWASEEVVVKEEIVTQDYVEEYAKTGEINGNR